MRYIIQIFKTNEKDSNVGIWSNTAYGGDDLEIVKNTAKKISTYNRMGIERVRVMENLFELKCSNVEGYGSLKKHKELVEAEKLRWDKDNKMKESVNG